MSDFSTTVVRNGFRQFSVAGRPFPVIGGTIGDSTASDPARLASDVWPAARALGVNTVFAPVTWQLLEPREGQFDFSVPDALFAGAREGGFKLAVIWYGAWKNGTSCYAPEWVKLDWNRFPLARPLLGRRTELLSPCAPEMLAAEKAAFSALAGRLRELEDSTGGDEPTILLVQVEEGIGMVGGSRDASGESDARWGAGVPFELIAGLDARAGRLHPEIAKALGRTGSWTEVFGPNAESAFMAWQFARHVEVLAAAGSSRLPVPYFVSAWNLPHAAGLAGEKPGGAPDGEMADVWDVAAPSVFRAMPSPSPQGLRFLHPSVGDNAVPVLFPRIEPGPDFPAKTLFLFGQILAAGVSATKIDAPGVDDGAGGLAAKVNSALRGLSGRLGAIRSADAVRGFMQTSGSGENVVLGDFSFSLQWTRPSRGVAVPGGLLLAMDRDGSYWAVGLGVRLSPRHDRSGWVTGILRQDELFSDGGELSAGRVLNGDEREILFPEGTVSVRRFKLYRRPL